MNFCELKKFDIANGEGVRTTLFVSGCRNHCAECFQPQTWDFGFGKEFTREVEDEILKSLEPSYVAGLTLLGGEPMEPENQRELLPFLRRVRTECPGKTIWLYTGFTWEQLTREPSRGNIDVTPELLECLDVIVDGPFLIAQKDISLRFCGSRNQRIIDVPATLAAGEVVLWVDEPVFSTHSW